MNISIAFKYNDEVLTKKIFRVDKEKKYHGGY